MKPFQERVVKEKEELDVKLSALGSFLNGAVFVELPMAEQGRLHWQYIHMCRYSGVLSERIAAFKEE